MHQLIPTTLFCVGLTTHIGLAVPKPFQTVWEQVTTDERRAHSIVEGNVWSKVGLAATKVSSLFAPNLWICSFIF